MSINPVLEAPTHILKALTKAASETGVDFSYLLKTASRESSFNNSAKAANSSAEGLFQFIENTWLETIKEEGHKFGLSTYADKISVSSDGKYQVTDKAARKEILELRNDAEISSLMAGAFSQKNSQFLQSKLGRAPSQGELYMAHFLGPSDAAKMIRIQELQPNAAATALFPSAAKANPSIFGEADNARTVQEVYQALTEKHENAAPQPVQTARHRGTHKNLAGPLISRASLAPLGNLFSNAPVNMGTTHHSLWGGPLPASTSNSADKSSDNANPLAWAAGRSLGENSNSGNEESWVGEQGWKVTVNWVTPEGPMGTRRNFKT